MLYYIGDVKRGNDIWDCMPHLINSIVYVYSGSNLKTVKSRKIFVKISRFKLEIINFKL